MAEWKLVGNYTGEMTVSVTGDKWKEATAAARERLEMRSRQVGTDPSTVEKADILNVAVNLKLQDVFAEGIGELGLTPVSEAVIDIPDLTSEGVTIVFRFAIAPEFELGDLSSLKYSPDEVIVTKEDIVAEITELKKSLEQQGEKVPEDPDEFARGFGIEGVSSMDDLMGSINDALIEKRSAVAAMNAENRLLDDLCELVDLVPPDGMVDMEVDSMITADKDKVASMNGEWEDFLKSARKGEADLREEYRPEAARSIKVRLILERIAAENNLYPSADDVEAEYRAMAEAYGVPVDDFRSAIPENDIIYQKSLVMAMDFLKK